MLLGSSAHWFWGLVNTLTPYAGNLMLHSLVLVLVGLMVVTMLKRASAAFKSLILRTVLATVLCSPIITYVIQSAGVHGFMLDIQRVAPATDISDAAETNMPLSILPLESDEQPVMIPYSVTQSVVRPDRSIAVDIIPHEMPRATIYAVLLGLWFLVTLYHVVRLVFSYCKVRYIRYYAEDASLHDIRLCRQVAHDLGARAPIVLRSDMISGPFMTGIRKPVMILPDDTVVSREVIYHEIAHLARCDCHWNILATLGIILVPLQPLMYMLAAYIEQYSDYVCDDFVLISRGDKKYYATQLLEFAERHIGMHNSLVVAGAVGSKSSLRKRVERIFKQQRVNIANGFRTVFIVFCVACFFVVSITSVYFSNSPQSRVSKMLSAMMIDIKPMPRQLLEHPKREAAPVEYVEPELHEIVEFTEVEDDVPDVLRNVVVYPEQPLCTDFAMMSAPEHVEHEHTPDTTDKIDDSEYSIAMAHHKQLMATLAASDSKNLTIEIAMEKLGLQESDLASMEKCRDIGIELLKTRWYDLAELIFFKALEFDMNNPEITNLLGKVYVGKWDLELARWYFKKVLVLEPHNAEAYYNLGNVYWLEGNRVMAMSAYGDAVELNPGYANTNRSIN